MAMNIKEVLKTLASSLKKYTDDAIVNKVDKKEGYSLIADSEIDRLKNVDNYDDTKLKALVDRKIEFIPAEFINETELETILSDYTKSSEMPTKVSQLTNDSGYITSVPSEYVTDSELTAKSYATKTYVLNEIAKIDTTGGSTSTGTTTTLPSYWRVRLDEIGEKIDTLQKENGMDTFQFLWCSDIHGVSGTAPSRTDDIGNIGRYMMDKYNIPFFAVSGDIMSQASHTAVEKIWAEYDKLTPMLSPIKNEEFLAVRGNHDGMWGSPMTVNGHANQYYHSYIGSQALFNAFMRRQTLDRGERVFGRDGMYFYVDFHNIRFYMLNTHTCGDESTNTDGTQVYNGFKTLSLGNEQLQWVADTLTTVKDNQKVIFMAHAPLNSVADGSVFNSIINMFVSRASGTKTGTVTGTFWGTDPQYANISVTADFTNAKGSIIGWFNGHIHKDSINTSAYSNLPMVSITTAGGDVRDTYYTDGTLTRQKKTATETAIDVVTVTSDYIYCTRIGSGYDRKLNLATKEVTIDYDSAYTSPAEPEEPEESLTQGEITSEVGVTFGKYQTGGEGNDLLTLTDSAYAITGIIDVVPNDIIRIKGFNFSDKSTNGTKILMYDSTGTCMKNRPLYRGCSDTTGVEFTFTGTNELAIKITDAMVSTNGGNAGSFVGTGISISNTHDGVSPIIITRNAEITSSMKGISPSGGNSGGNTSTLTQGEITSEITWQKDKRLSSSSNSYSSATGIYATSDIKVENGDVIRIYNADWTSVISGAYRYVNAYDSSSTILKNCDLYNGLDQTTSHFTTAYSSDGNFMTITIIHDNVDFIRFCIPSDDTNITKVRVSRNAILSGDSGGNTSTLTQGDITHEVGYQLDKRYSTSGGVIKDTNSTNGRKTLALDLIALAPNDVIRVKGLTYATTNADPVLAIFSEDGTYTTGVNLATNNVTTNFNGTGIGFSIDGDLLTITESSGWSKTRLIGICGYYGDPVRYTVTRNAEIAPTSYNLLPTDTSGYTLNKKYSEKSIVDGNGRYLTPIMSVDINSYPYLNVSGLCTGVSAVKPFLYKVGFYTGNVLTYVEYFNNWADDTTTAKSINILDKGNYGSCDGIQLEICVSSSAITTSDIITNGSIKATLSKTAGDFGDDTPSTSTLPQGDITSSVTWTKNQRYSTSSGTLKAQTGWSSTSHIEVEPNDVIRIKGTGFFSETTSGNCVVVAFDSTDTFISSSGTYIYGGNINKDVSNGKYHVKSIGTDGIEITNSGTVTRYFAITVKGTDTSSAIITRNMEIN